jgi:hypothetical protein
MVAHTLLLSNLLLIYEGVIGQWSAQIDDISLLPPACMQIEYRMGYSCRLCAFYFKKCRV